MIKFIQLFILIIGLTLCTYSGKSQSIIDSLKTVYPNQENSEKAKTLAELCYQLSNNDSKTAIHYGELSYQVALRTNDSVLIANCLNDWSIPFLVQGDSKQVLLLNEKALAIRVALGDSIGVAKSLNKMANAYFELGMLNKTLTCNLRALSIFENNNLEIYSGQIIGNIGVIYERNGMFDEAIKNYKKGQIIAENTGNIPAYYTAIAGEANCLTKLGKYNIADSLMQEALIYYLQENNVNFIASIYQNLGLNSGLNNKRSESKKYYQKAYDLYEKNNSEVGMSLILGNLAHVYMDEQDFERAEESLENSLNLALKNNSFYQLKQTYQAFTRLEHLRGNPEKADYYFDLYVEQMDSLYNKETNSLISDMQVKYNTAQKIKELETEKLKRKTTQLGLLVAGIIIVLLLVLVLFIRYKKSLQKEILKVEALKKLEKERSRIARDLHDNLGAELSLISSKIDIQSFKNKNTALQLELDKIATISKNANHQLRETIWSIHKPSIELNELGRKMEEYGKRIFDNTPVNFKMDCVEVTKNLSSAMALHLFRISQEMINNAFKYANANLVTVHLNENKLQIKDNGTGFDINTVRRGYGINNIEERISEIGNNFTLRSNENGTELIVLFEP